MRNVYSLLAAALFFLMLLVPLAAKNADLPSAETPKSSSKAEDVFRVKTEEGIEKIPADEYVRGVVAAEMPALYKEEALKAQAVAAYTYAARKRALSSDSEYDITTDNKTDQSYISESERKKRWGGNFEKYEKKIRSAVKSVSGQALKYDGEYILAAYHAISAGKTEAASDVWGGDYPYLQSVESIADMLSDGYKTELDFTAEKFCELMKPEVEISGEHSGFLGEIERSSVGTVKKIKIGGKELSGSRVRELLSLRSANFEISATDTGFHLTVYGFGHGVGLSQYGANALAEQGSDYKEILLWYYPGCVLSGE